MRIENETEYQSVGMQKCLTAAHNHLAKSEGRMRQWSGVTFTVVYTRSRGCNGYAYLGGYDSRLRVPRPKEGDDWRTGCTVRSFIRLAWHEMLHLYEYRHSQMARRYPGEDEVQEMAEAAGFRPRERLPLYADARRKLGLEPEPEGPTEAEKYEQELRHALRKRKQWTTRARRAKTGLKKWRSREMYRRRKLEELGVDVDSIIQDELGGYEPAMPGDLDL